MPPTFSIEFVKIIYIVLAHLEIASSIFSLLKSHNNLKYLNQKSHMLYFSLKQGELEMLLQEALGPELIHIQDLYYDQGNWCACFVKKWKIWPFLFVVDCCKMCQLCAKLLLCIFWNCFEKMATIVVV